MTTRYSMRMIEVYTIEFNINLTQNDIESIDVMTLDDDNKEVALINNVDYQLSHNNKTIFNNLSNKKILYIKITRKSDKNFLIEKVESKYKNKDGEIISFFNAVGNKLCYYVGFPDRTRR